MLALNRTRLTFALAVLVAAFVSLHPYLDPAGLCGSGGCPEPSHPSHSSHAAHAKPSDTCPLGALVAPGATPFALAAFLGRRGAGDRPRPAGPCLPPDTPPPKAPAGR